LRREVWVPRLGSVQASLRFCTTLRLVRYGTRNITNLKEKNMKNLKRLGISVTLVCVLAMSSFAGETNSPPCAPGETNSPPCSAAQLTPDDSATTDETSSSPATNTGAEYSVAEAAVDVLQSFFLIF
jgi:hypothetical protein